MAHVQYIIFFGETDPMIAQSGEVSVGLMDQKILEPQMADKEHFSGASLEKSSSLHFGSELQESPNARRISS